MVAGGTAAAGLALGYLFWGRRKPPVSLSPREQQALTARGVVWAAPGTPDPPGVDDMIGAGHVPLLGAGINQTLDVLGPNRLGPMMDLGWRFWQPKKPKPQ